MADFHDSHPNTDSSGHPAGAVATFGDVATSQAANEVAGEGAANTNNDRVPAKPKSDVWAHYGKMPDYARTKLVKCRRCAKQYVCNNGSTGSMCVVHYPCDITSQQRALAQTIFEGNVALMRSVQINIPQATT
jgi:BED zinc finger